MLSKDQLAVLVYMHTNKITNKSYIGTTNSTIAQRFYKHCHEAAHNTLIRSKFHRALRKYGTTPDVWDSVVLYVCTDRTEGFRAEVELIHTFDTFHNGYNTTPGGYSGPTLTGPDNGMFGKTHTPEVKAKLSKLAKDRYTGVSYEERHGEQKAVELKQRRSDDMKRIRSETPSTGTTNSNAKTYVLQDSTGTTYTIAGSIQQFCKDHDMWVGGIIDVAKGRRAEYKGWIVLSVNTIH